MIQLNATVRAGRRGGQNAARRRQGGAILVEAVITISTLTLGLLGLAFFRDFYIDQIKVSRLARAQVIAHSMVGCEQESREWIGKDLGAFTGFNPQQQEQTAAGDPGASYAPGAEAPPVAGQLLEQAPGTTTGGEGLLNPISTSGVAGQVRAAANDPNGGGRVFEAVVRSNSYVTCGDEVRKRDVEEVLDMTKDQLMMFLGMGG
jgi:hypothetical protein